MGSGSSFLSPHSSIHSFKDNDYNNSNNNNNNKKNEENYKKNKQLYSNINKNLLSSSDSNSSSNNHYYEKYGPPPPPIGNEYLLWKCKYLYSEGTLIKKIRKETNHLRLKILMDIPLVFLQKTILIIYHPFFSVCDVLIKFISQKLNFSIIQKTNYESLGHMYLNALQNNSIPGCIFTNFPTTSTEIDQFNEETWAYRKIVLVFEYDLMKLVRSKENLWIHEPSGRLYDVEISPPKQLTRDLLRGVVDEKSSYIDDLTKEPLVMIEDKSDIRIQIRKHMRMMSGMRTHYSYCASGIQINPTLQPGGTNIMRHKTEIVNTLCKYITHQQKHPQRDLKTLTSLDFATDLENGVLSTDVSNIVSPGQTLTTNETNTVLTKLHQNYNNNNNNNQQGGSKPEFNWLGFSSSGSISPLPSILENLQVALEPSQDKIGTLNPEELNQLIRKESNQYLNQNLEKIPESLSSSINIQLSNQGIPRNDNYFDSRTNLLNEKSCEHSKIISLSQDKTDSLIIQKDQSFKNLNENILPDNLDELQRTE